ncbi:MAG: hypothetical protein QXF41_03735, partial [Candidatus Micrarchaeaceae archaeon]
MLADKHGLASTSLFVLIIAIVVSILMIVYLYITNPGILSNLSYLLTLIKASPAISPSQVQFTAYNCITTPCAPFSSSYSSDTWSLYYGGSTQTQPLNSPIDFTVYNGTYTLASQAVYVGGQYKFLCPQTPDSGVYYNYSVPSGNSYKIYYYPCKLETTTFTESGLPSGQSWNLTYDGLFMASTTSSIQFQVPIAKYAFAVNKSQHYIPSPASGALESGQTQTIAFTPIITYETTTFNSGLSQFASYYTGNWTLSYDGVIGTNTSLAKPIYITTNGGTGSYTATAYINNYVCNAKAQSVAIGSTYTFSDWNCRTLFSESGLPLNKNWNLTYDSVFNGSTKSTIPINTSGGYYKFSYFVPEKIPTSNQQQTLTPPAGIEYYVPITITNTQNSPTPAPFQQEVTVNSAQYQSYEAANLDNIEFFYQNWQVIPSWLESGASSDSTQTIYWLKLSDSIPADSSITVYMGFAATSTNLFNGNTVGEAPGLSPTYGEYDDGAEVFNYYQPFGGLSAIPSGWNEVSGTDIYFYPDYTYLIGGSSAGWYGIYMNSLSSMTNFPTIIEWYGNEYDDSTGYRCYGNYCFEISAGTSVGLMSSTIGSNPAYSWDEGINGNPTEIYVGNDNTQFYQDTGQYDTDVNKIYSLYITNPYSMSLYENYSLLYSASNLASTA